jgi:hypothetical protein
VQPENAAAETTPVGVDPAEAASYLASITDNYSQYRAVATIPWGNAIAFNIGDPVPADYPTLEQLKAGRARRGGRRAAREGQAAGADMAVGGRGVRSNLGRVDVDETAIRDLASPAGPVARYLARGAQTVTQGAKRRAPVSPRGSHGRRSGYLRSEIGWVIEHDA